MTSSLTFDFSLNKSLKTLCQKSQKLDHHLHMNSTNSDAVFLMWHVTLYLGKLRKLHLGQLAASSTDVLTEMMWVVAANLSPRV